MAAKLEVISLVYDQETNKTTIGFHRFNTDNADQDDLGTWIVDGSVDQDAALAYAKTMVESNIEVALNISDKPMADQTADAEAKHDEAVAGGEPVNTDIANEEGNDTAKAPGADTGDKG